MKIVFLIHFLPVVSISCAFFLFASDKSIKNMAMLAKAFILHKVLAYVACGMALNEKMLSKSFRFNFPKFAESLSRRLSIRLH